MYNRFTIILSIILLWYHEYWPISLFIEFPDFMTIHSSVAPDMYNTSSRWRHETPKASFNQLQLKSKSMITALMDGRSKASLRNLSLPSLKDISGCEANIQSNFLFYISYVFIKIINQ